MTYSTLYMVDLFIFSLEKSLSQVFSRIKLHKKGSRNIDLFLLKEGIAILRSVNWGYYDLGLDWISSGILAQWTEITMI